MQRLQNKIFRSTLRVSTHTKKGLKKKSSGPPQHPELLQKPKKSIQASRKKRVTPLSRNKRGLFSRSKVKQKQKKSSVTHLISHLLPAASIATISTSAGSKKRRVIAPMEGRRSRENEKHTAGDALGAPTPGRLTGADRPVRSTLPRRHRRGCAVAGVEGRRRRRSLFRKKLFLAAEISREWFSRPTSSEDSPCLPPWMLDFRGEWFFCLFHQSPRVRCSGGRQCASSSLQARAVAACGSEISISSLLLLVMRVVLFISRAIEGSTVFHEPFLA